MFKGGLMRTATQNTDTFRYFSQQQLRELFILGSASVFSITEKKPFYTTVRHYITTVIDSYYLHTHIYSYIVIIYMYI